MFVAFVKTKTYIAVVLTFIFLAKFVAIDAHAFNTFFNADDIIFVNPHCKKQSPVDTAEKAHSFSQPDHNSDEMFTLSGHCTAPFYLELFSWNINFSDPIVVIDEHVPSPLNYRYLDSVSPPPRLA